MLQAFKNTKFNFIRSQKIAYSISILVILIGVVSVVMHRGFNLSVDFIGGTTMQMKFQKPFHDDGRLELLSLSWVSVPLR